jgi:ethanolamine ammonia-lyase small subunit
VPVVPALDELARRVRAVTPARVFTGRVGTSYRTRDLLALRADHAAARAAVDTDIDLGVPPLSALAEPAVADGLFLVSSAAADRQDYLRRPEAGRRLSDAARATLLERCPAGADVQIVVGDGLSAAAVAAQVPGLLPLLSALAAERGWRLGRTFAVRHCRVGIMNDVGAVLRPRAVVLLIGERPGLATARSLSAYLAWRPGPGMTDADRNLVANIHDRGLGHAEAARRVVGVLEAMRAAGASGIAIKEPDPVPELPPTTPDTRWEGRSAKPLHEQ